MEGPVTGLRSRSRSKTPLPDSELLKSTKKAATGRSTPLKSLTTLVEQTVESSPAQRTRAAVAALASDYSEEDGADVIPRSKEQLQNKLNSQYEYSRVTTTTAHAADTSEFRLSPSKTSSPYSHSYNAGLRRSYSPVSACSTDSSFAEQALADITRVTEKEPHSDCLPFKLYKLAGEYWNKYPKTDYTYSRLSRDRVELAPGQVAVPNMSRRSLAQYRLTGDTTSDQEIEKLMRQSGYDSSEDEYVKRSNGYGVSGAPRDQRWWITRVLVAIVTAVTSVATETWGAVRGRGGCDARRYRQGDEPGLVSRAASAAVFPLVWIYSVIKTVVTTTTTTISGKSEADGAYFARRAGAGGGAHASRARAQQKQKRRLWPWLLLLPLIGFACCNAPELYRSFVKESRSYTVEGYAPPAVIQDADFSRRLSVLEEWMKSLDYRLSDFNQKLSKIERIEAQIDLHQNLIQTFNFNQDTQTTEQLEKSLDSRYISKSQLDDFERRLKDGLKKPEIDEEYIRKLISEYLSEFESKQVVLLKEKTRVYIREMLKEGCGDFDEDRIRKIVAEMLNVYDADKTGIVDYAMESAGGQVISTRCTELYTIKTKQYYFLGLPMWWVYTSPRYALTPGAMPAECWAFQGFPGYLVVRTFATIEVTGFSIEHMSRLLTVDGKIESAPKNFSVYGLRDENDASPHKFGSYMYDARGPAIQHFPVHNQSSTDVGGRLYPVAYDLLELRIETNHGNPTYTCVYRFRVHGNPLSDTRYATEDSLNEAE